MHELASAFLHFDPPFPGLIGGTIIQGWVVPKPGRHFTDLRARAGGREFPAVLGIPREDLARFFKSSKRYLLAGFSATLTLPAGRHRVEFDVLTIQGRWEHLDGIDWDVNANEALPDPETRVPLNADNFGEALRIVLRRLGHEGRSAGEIAGEAIAATAVPHHLQHPPRPFHGHLDQPRTWERSLFGRLPLSGWVYHESQPIQRVLATVDLQAVQEMKLGRATDFLGARSGNSPLATHCGYDGFLDLPAQLPKPVTVRIYAELADGSWHLGSVARFNETDQEFLKQPYGRFSPLAFWRAWRALVAAGRTAGWPLPEGRGPVIRQVWRDYVAQAPRAASRTPARVPASRARPTKPRVHLVTHNLNREGAPLFFLEYARHLRAEGHELALTSGAEGPLRADFAALGIPVAVVDVSALTAATGARELRDLLSGVAARVPLGDTDLLVANTLSAWWGVHLAHRAGRPSLFYIHESTSPNGFFRGLMPAPALAVVEETFRLATRVSFLTATTQRYYTDLSDGSNYCLNPGWIDLAAIDRFRAGRDRAALRAQLGLPADRPLAINVGTVCERKGQHIFIRTIDTFMRHYAAGEKYRFLFVGGRPGEYQDSLVRDMEMLGITNVDIITETREAYDFFALADLFVCTSYEESFPRVLLEAMAFETPIVSTDVHGIPEMVTDKAEAYLVEPGHPVQFAKVMKTCLDKLRNGTSTAPMGYSKVVRAYDIDRVLPKHADMAREAVLDFDGDTRRQAPHKLSGRPDRFESSW